MSILIRSKKNNRFIVIPVPYNELARVLIFTFPSIFTVNNGYSIIILVLSFNTIYFFLIRLRILCFCDKRLEMKYLFWFRNKSYDYQEIKEVRVTPTYNDYDAKVYLKNRKKMDLLFTRFLDNRFEGNSTKMTKLFNYLSEYDITLTVKGPKGVFSRIIKGVNSDKIKKIYK